ncbi:helix-turn-helix domain-containing protein [Paenibacillus sp. MMO-58]|uniref:helix-turn-helix domain-containing protein n=1 Tax=Paenibacillus sp. MMO-58 TaxID=3081290 RepID=UPI003015E37A
MDFSKAVKEAMEAQGIKRSDVAKASGYSHQYISDLLSGDRRWNEVSINKVSAALNIKINLTHEPSKEETEAAVND